MPNIPNPHSELLREPNLLTPGKKPIASVKVDYNHPMATGYVESFIPSTSHAPSVLTTGRPIVDWDYTITSIDPYKDTYQRVPLSNDTSTYLQTQTSASEGLAPFGNVGNAFVGNTVCVMFELEIADIDYFNTDHSVIDFDTDGSQTMSSFSWLDRFSSTLRMAIYTTYDTTNVISTVGRYMMGFMVDADGSYQTVFNGRYSQSGTATRRDVSELICFGGGAKETMQTSKNNGDLFVGGPVWMHTWNRRLSEDECQSIYRDPYQFLIPA